MLSYDALHCVCHSETSVIKSHRDIVNFSECCAMPKHNNAWDFVSIGSKIVMYVLLDILQNFDEKLSLNSYD